MQGKHFWHHNNLLLSFFGDLHSFFLPPQQFHSAGYHFYNTEAIRGGPSDQEKLTHLSAGVVCPLSVGRVNNDIYPKVTS